MHALDVVRVAKERCGLHPSSPHDESRFAGSNSISTVSPQTGQAREAAPLTNGCFFADAPSTTASACVSLSSNAHEPVCQVAFPSTSDSQCDTQQFRKGLECYSSSLVFSFVVETRFSQPRDTGPRREATRVTPQQLPLVDPRCFHHERPRSSVLLSWSGHTLCSYVSIPASSSFNREHTSRCRSQINQTARTPMGSPY